MKNAIYPGKKFL